MQANERENQSGGQRGRDGADGRAVTGAILPVGRHDFPGRFMTWHHAAPFYDEELQAVCLDVRRRNCGVDGKPVLFYARRPLAAPVPVRKPRKAAAANDDRHADLVDGLKGLGLAAVTAAQVAEAVKESVPQRGSERSPRGGFAGRFSCTSAASIQGITSG